MTTVDKRMTILFAEDNEDDALLLRKAYQQLRPVVQVQIAPDGKAAIDYLNGEGAYSDRNKYPLPDLFITDLKMPRVGGFEVLKWMQERPQCKLIPKVVLSNSSLPHEVTKAYELSANAFFKKPVKFYQFVDLVGEIVEFWSKAELPGSPSSATS